MKLHLPSHSGVTLIENVFIDQYMPRANGEFVKLYLYLLRCAGANRELSLSSIADVFDHTEKDVRRALAYWEKLNLLKLRYDGSGALCDILFLNGEEPEAESGRSGEPAKSMESVDFAGTAAGHYTIPGTSGEPAAAGKPGGLTGAGGDGRFTGAGVSAGSDSSHEPMWDSSAMTAAALSETVKPAGSGTPSPRPAISRDRTRELKEQKQLKQLIFVAEQYYARPLTSTEQANLLYFYDTLHFSPDLIEYLIEYCVSKGTTGPHYMEKVAQEWAKEGITTVTEAKNSTNLYNKNYFTIFNSMGIKGRNPAPAEIEYMNRWLNEFDFTIEIILEACCRTIRQTHQPNFQYANKILEQWHKAGVHHLTDIKALDLKHAEKQKPAARTQPKSSAPNRFNNFPQREYNWDELEQKLLNAQTKKEG